MRGKEERGPLQPSLQLGCTSATAVELTKLLVPSTLTSLNTPVLASHSEGPSGTQVAIVVPTPSAAVAEVVVLLPAEHTDEWLPPGAGCAVTPTHLLRL